jgi:CRP/FNR family transcriptional regulator
MKLTEDQREMVRKSSLGWMLGEKEIGSFLDSCELRKKARGSHLFREGDSTVGFLVMLGGRIKLYRLGQDGRETVLHFADPPAVVAEAALFIGKYPASAIALVDSEYLFISRQTAFQMIEHGGRFARFLLEGMAFWLNKLVKQIEDLTVSDATSRLSRYLLDLHEKNPPKLSPLPPKVQLPVKKGELALLLNMQLPSLSRIFRKLQDERVIDVKGNSIALLDVAALRRFTLPPLD